MKKLLFIIILFSLLSPTFIYTIDETEQVIITELGEFKRTVSTPGLKFKKPL